MNDRFFPVSQLTRQRPEALGQALRREINRLDPNLPLYYVATPKENLDSFVYIAVFALVVVVSLAAVLVPGRRGSRVDPLVALRAE